MTRVFHACLDEQLRRPSGRSTGGECLGLNIHCCVRPVEVATLGPTQASVGDDELPRIFWNVLGFLMSWSPPAMPCRHRASVTAVVMASLRRGKNGAVEKYSTPPLGRWPPHPGSRHHLCHHLSEPNKSSQIISASSDIHICQRTGIPETIVVAGPSLGPRRTEMW